MPARALDRASFRTGNLRLRGKDLVPLVYAAKCARPGCSVKTGASSLRRGTPASMSAGGARAPRIHLLCSLRAGRNSSVEVNLRCASPLDQAPLSTRKPRPRLQRLVDRARAEVRVRDT